jgi:hypothetical protein
MKQLKIGKKKVAEILVFLWMILPGSGPAAERKSDLRITYRPPHISVEAREAKLREVLREISVKAGFELADYGMPDSNLTVSIEEATVEDVLRQLLRGENYSVVYQEKDRAGAISKVLLLSSPIYAQAPMSEYQQTGTEASRGQDGLTVFSATPSYESARPEQTRESRTENEPKVEDILRAHAISGLQESDIFPQSLTPNAPQPLRNSTPAFPPAEAASFTTPSLGDTNENLAMTTRLAQQNLKSLAEGLATATHSLLNLQPTSGHHGGAEGVSVVNTPLH